MNNSFAWNEQIPKGQQNLSVLIPAASQCSRIYLIVSCLNLLMVLNKEAKSYQTPFRVFPLSSYRKGY